MKELIFAGTLLVASTAFSQSNSKIKMETIITEQVNTLFAGADERNWNKVKSVMDNQVLLDYSSMTGSSSSNLTPKQIITAWAAFLPGFDRTNHKLSGFKIEINGDEAVAIYIGKADHYLNSEVWTVEGSYNTKLKRVGENWLINAHTFNFEKQGGNIGLPTEASKKMERLTLTENNRKVVDNFFIALETQKFEILKDVFAENGKQLNPYSPAGFPKSFDGAEGIYKQYSGLTANFGQMKFPRQIFATEDPNFFFVKFKGEIEIKAGGKYENDYLGMFKLENGKVVEYTEYFNQIVMAKAFGIDLK
ncbi:MAG: PhzA/PhzB family protein [Rhizobacter sp.]|nr:PhzA/PhzB family protein [Ferruginibacter sp.]